MEGQGVLVVDMIILLHLGIPAVYLRSTVEWPSSWACTRKGWRQMQYRKGMVGMCLIRGGELAPGLLHTPVIWMHGLRNLRIQKVALSAQLAVCCNQHMDAMMRLDEQSMVSGNLRGFCIFEKSWRSFAVFL